MFRDVLSRNELNKTQEESKKLEEQSRLLFNQNPKPMLIYSLDNLTIIDVNDTIVEDYGYSKDEFLKLKVNDLKPKNKIKKVNQEVIGEREGVNKVTKMLHELKNGKIINVELTGRTIEYNNKEARLVLIKDITKETLIQEQLEKTLKGLTDYKIALDASSIVSVADADGTIIYVNKKFCEISEYTEKELLGQNHRMLNSGHHPKEFWTKLWNTINGGKVFHARVKNKTKNETYYWVDTSIIPFMGKNNKPYQFLVIRKDITKAKLNEEKVRESEKDHRLFFENNPTPMFVFSEKTNKILGVNETMKIQYGYSKEEFLNLDLVDRALYNCFLKIINPNSNENNEWSHVVKSGNFIIVKAKTADIYYKKERVKLVSINDITKIKFHEIALEDAKSRAEKAKEHQSQFLSSMSHEIRTPMNGIIGMTRLLQKTNQSIDQKKYTNAIFTSAENLMVIINEILDYSKIESGKFTIENIPFNLDELSVVWDETLKLNAENKNISFNINIHPDVPNNLIGDPIRLNQVIYNLAGNAIKFTSQGGVSIDLFVKENTKNIVELQCDIKDDGIGIAENKLESIFSSFSQASSSTTREYGGTGLGLTITKQLIELQNGKLWVESQEGVGSTFSFILSFGIQNENIIQLTPLNEKDKNSDIKLGNLNILLVEDHDINQMLATTVLENWGFKVDLAENGLEAIEKVASNKYDIILMDIHMPKMDGYDATEQIREKLKDKTPIVAMTASAAIGDNKKCFKVGMNDYISKPFNPELLFEKISFQINKKSA
jgi:PAS domain S-box-containing protein